MNQLRDEVSKFMGLCEQLRLLDNNKFDTSNPIYGALVTSMYKIELLLDKRKEDQKKLLEDIILLCKMADSKDFTGFKASQRNVVDITISILDKHWNQISSELKKTIAIPKCDNIINLLKR